MKSTVLSYPRKANAVASNDLTASSVATDVTLVGLDWGTNTSCLMASPMAATETTVSEQIPTVIGTAADNVLEGVLPNNARTLYGREAQKYRTHLTMHHPLRNGVIADQAMARMFAQYLRTRLPVDAGEIRAVIGMPASSDLVARENARSAVQGLFSKVLFVPEPFLAAMGYRDETRLSDPDYQDPVLNSLYIDIGAGSTDVCLVQGHYPTVEDQMSVPFAGDAVDQIIHDAIMAAYPDCGLTLNRVKEIKEKHSFAMSDGNAAPVIATIIVGGKPRKIDITAQVAAGCDALLQKAFDMTCQLIARSNPDLVTELLQNVIVTGGGSLIKGFGVALQTKLLEEGFENPRVRTLGDNYKNYVALGALKAARQAKDRQWQNLLG